LSLDAINRVLLRNGGSLAPLRRVAAGDPM
jgi:hypothetical protein